VNKSKMSDDEVYNRLTAAINAANEPSVTGSDLIRLAAVIKSLGPKYGHIVEAKGHGLDPSIQHNENYRRLLEHEISRSESILSRIEHNALCSRRVAVRISRLSSTIDADVYYVDGFNDSGTEIKGT